jgi:3-oxoadipate enol-lactonase
MRLATRSVGDGPAVVWLHGYTMDSSLWDELWSLLPGLRHVGVDLPGHGGSDPMPPGTTLQDIAAAVASVSRSVDATALAALSFGTTVAIQVAVDHPDVASRLVLAAPAIGSAPEEPGTRDRYWQLFALRSMGASGDDLAGCWMQSPPDIFRGTESIPELHHRVRAVVARHAWTELAGGRMRRIVRHAQADQLGAITSDVCVLVGEHDLLSTRNNVNLLRAELAHCTVHEIADAGHLCLLERPEAAAPLLATHLGT